MGPQRECRTEKKPGWAGSGEQQGWKDGEKRQQRQEKGRGSLGSRDMAEGTDALCTDGGGQSTPSIAIRITEVREAARGWPREAAGRGRREERRGRTSPRERGGFLEGGLSRPKKGLPHCP